MKYRLVHTETKDMTQNLLEELLEQDFPAYIVEGDRLYRVRVGNYITLEDAARMEQMLKRAGYPTVIVST